MHRYKLQIHRFENNGCFIAVEEKIVFAYSAEDALTVWNTNTVLEGREYNDKLRHIEALDDIERIDDVKTD